MGALVVLLILAYLAIGYWLAVDIDRESWNTKICVMLIWPVLIALYLIFIVGMFIYYVLFGG